MMGGDSDDDDDAAEIEATLRLLSICIFAKLSLHCTEDGEESAMAAEEECVSTLEVENTTEAVEEEEDIVELEAAKEEDEVDEELGSKELSAEDGKATEFTRGAGGIGKGESSRSGTDRCGRGRLTVANPAEFEALEEPAMGEFKFKTRGGNRTERAQEERGMELLCARIGEMRRCLSASRIS